MVESDSVAAGSIIGGKYVLGDVIGEGAMGRVVAGHHADLDRDVALKFMITHRGVEGERLARFMREARAAAKLTSPHVVRIFDVGRTESGIPYLVMERLSGEDLSSYVAQRRVLDPFEAADIVAQACEGIAEAHQQGIVHRDIKPQNLFVCREASARASGPARRMVKVLDFGLSKIEPSKGSARAEAAITKAPIGSPLYMAPEQLRSTTEIDKRADVWALGTTLYELLTGDPPFVAETLGEIFLMIAQDDPVPARQRRPEVPALLDAIVGRCLRKSPGERFPDAQALGEALSQFLAGASRVSPALAATTADPLSEAEAPTVRGPDLADSRAASARANGAGHGSLISSTSPIVLRQGPRRTWIVVATLGGLALVAALAIALRPTKGLEQATHAGDVTPTPGATVSTAAPVSTVAEAPAPPEPKVIPGELLPSAATSAPPSATSASASAVARKSEEAPVIRRPGVAPPPPAPSHVPQVAAPPGVDPNQVPRNF